MLTLEEKARYEKYFSIDQENELVLKTLNILKENKLRKQEAPPMKYGQSVERARKCKPLRAVNKTEDVFHLNSLNKIK